MDRLYMTIVNNPLDRQKNREQRSFLYEPKPLSAYINDAKIVRCPNEKVHVRYGGKLIEEDKLDSIIPLPEEVIVVLPHVAGGGRGSGQQDEMLVAEIFLMAVSYGVGSAIAAGGEWSANAYLAATAVQVVGGYLISNYMQKQQQQDKQSQTYGWQITTEFQPGGAVQETAGSVRTGGTLIEYKVIADGDKQYLNVLLCGGEGPIDYDEETGDPIGIDPTTIRINDNPLSNYDDVNVVIRPGLNDQDVIPMFSETNQTQSLGDELKAGDDYIYHDTNGDGANALEITFVCPKGLYHINQDTGRYEVATIVFDIGYQKVGDTTWNSLNGTQQAVKYPSKTLYRYGHDMSSLPIGAMLTGDLRATFTEGEVITVWYAGGEKTRTIEEVRYDTGITYIYYDKAMEGVYAIGYYSSSQILIQGKSPNATRQTFKIRDVPKGQYQVRAKVVSKSGPEDNTNYAVDVYWESLTQIIYDSFTYPNKVLIGITALASDKLANSMPNITWVQTSSNCWVWNPNTNQYEQRAKTNPAWRCYDIFHNVKRLKNINTGEWEFVVRGEKASKIDYQSFANWAEFCDRMGLKCNYIHDKIVNRYDACDPIATLGRGKCYQKGTLISCWYDDYVYIPAQQFNGANTGTSGFSLEYMNIQDRANAVEVTFYDASRDYEQRSITVYGDGWDDDNSVQNPTQLTLPACTDYNMAFKHAKYELRKNQYIVRSGSWPASIDSIACGVGDVVTVQNPTTKWGMAGGRIKTVTDDTIQLDRKLDLDTTKTYAIRYRLADDTFVDCDVTPQWGELEYDALVAQIGVSPQVQHIFGKDGSNVDTLTLSTPFEEDTENATKVDDMHFTVNGNRTTTYLVGNQIVMESDYNQTDVTTVITSSYNASTGLTTVQVSDTVPDELTQVRWQFTKPRPKDLFDFGETGKVNKLWRIISSSRGGDHQRTFQALEYRPEVYDDSADVPPEIDWYDTTTTDLRLTVNESTDKRSGKVYINISWVPHSTYGGALVLIDGKKVYEASMSETNYTMEVQSLTTYSIQVQLLDMFKNASCSETITYTVVSDPPPVSPTNITIIPAVKSCMVVI